MNHHHQCIYQILKSNVLLSKSNAVSGSCDHNGGVLTSKNGDINITVPAGAIKYRDCVKFYIATDLYGPYALPSQCQNNLISPFYWIGVSGLYHCFILNVVKDPECTTTLNTDIIVTLYNIEERKDIPCTFNLIIPVSSKYTSSVPLVIPTIVVRKVYPNLVRFSVIFIRNFTLLGRCCSSVRNS